MAAKQSLYDWLVRHYPRIERHYRLEDMWSLRRDLLQLNPDLRHIDHIIIFNVLNLKRTLRACFSYYHRARTHLALDKQCPEPR